MSFEGQAVKVLPLDDGLVELRFDLQGEPVNTCMVVFPRLSSHGMDEEQATKYHNLFNEVIQQMRTLDAKRKYSQNLTVRVA